MNQLPPDPFGDWGNLIIQYFFSFLPFIVVGFLVIACYYVRPTKTSKSKKKKKSKYPDFEQDLRRFD